MRKKIFKINYIYYLVLIFYYYLCSIIKLQVGEVVSRKSHNLEIIGSSPILATIVPHFIPYSLCVL
jgi:hypothetical protein